MMATASVIEWDWGVIVAARLPSRCTWMRSATWNTCGMLCEIRMTGTPCSRRRVDEFEYLVRLPHAERGGGLVEDHDLRAERRGTRHGDGLALAARQILHGNGDILQRRDAELVHLLPCLPAHARLVEGAEDRTQDSGLASLPTEEQVRCDVESG